MDLGTRLKAERERLGLSQTEFAALAGASKHAQINWEKGTAAPNATALAAWAAHGLDVLYVVTGQRSGLPRPGDVTRELGIGQVVPGLTASDVMRGLKGIDIEEIRGNALEHLGLNRREKALLANYRGSDEKGRKALEGAASALSHKDSDEQERQGGE